MSVTAAPGFVAAGIAAGIKASGAPDLSLVATADGRPVAAAGVFTRNLMTAAPVQISKAHLRRRRRGRGGRAQQRQRQRRHRRGRHARRRRDVRHRRRRARRRPPPGARLLHRPHRHPHADRDRSSGAIPALVAARSADGGAAAADRHHDHRHPRQGGRRSQGDGLHRRRHGQGRGDALAEHGHDARGAHHRRRRPTPEQLKAALTARRGRLVQRPRRRRLHVHQRHRARARQRPGRPGRRRRPSPPRWPRRAPTSPSRWPATPRAPPRSCASTVAGAHSDEEARIGRPRGVAAASW